MRAGSLRNRLVLQSKVETRGAAGGVATTWTTQDTVWGGIHIISGKEFTAIQQTQNEARVKIIIRYQSSIDETWRVVNDGLAYAIESIINFEDRDRMMTLMCLQGVKEAADLPTGTEFYVVNSGTNVVNSGVQVIST